MRHLIVIIVLLLFAYFAWSYFPSKDKGAIKRFLVKHLPFVAFILATIFVLMVAQFNVNALQLL